MSYIFAVDPGNIESAYVLLDERLKPLRFGKVLNEQLQKIIAQYESKEIDFVIEKIASYGMAVGASVFDTCIWIGRFWETAEFYKSRNYILRMEEKMNLCHNSKAKDANIRQALIDRFGIVGTKKDPGWFYGVSKDVWAAIAVGVTFADKENWNERSNIIL